MISRKFTVVLIQKQRNIIGSGREAKEGNPEYVVGLSEDSKVINRLSFSISLTKEEAITLRLGSTFTLTEDSNVNPAAQEEKE